MSKTRTISVELPEEMVAFAERKVAAGEYGGIGDFVEAAIQGAQDREKSFEEWVKTEVAAAYDDWKSNPDDSVDASEAFGEIRDELAARQAKGA